MSQAFVQSPTFTCQHVDIFGENITAFFPCIYLPLIHPAGNLILNYLMSSSIWLLIVKKKLTLYELLASS